MNKTDIIYSCCYRFVYQLNLKRLDYVFSPFLANIMQTRTVRVSVREGGVGVRRNTSAVPFESTVSTWLESPPSSLVSVGESLLMLTVAHAGRSGQEITSTDKHLPRE